MKDTFVVLASVIVLAVGASLRPQAQSSPGLPVLFVHGFCSSSDIWWDMTTEMQQNQPARFASDGITRLHSAHGAVFNRDDFAPSRVKFKEPSSAKRLFTIDFYNDEAASFGRSSVADTGLIHKSAELAAVIKEVARISNAPKVIVVGHSQGGLIARAYVQGLAQLHGSPVPYTNDVGQIITIDTPHKGSALARGLELLGCVAGGSDDRDDLKPGSPFLSALNDTNARGRYIPDSVTIAAIVSWSSKEMLNGTSNKAGGDGVVRFAEQGLKDIAPYDTRGFDHVWRDEENRIDAFFPCGASDFCEMHTSIYKRHETIDVVRKLIMQFDAALPATLTVDTAPGSQSTVLRIAGKFFTPRGVAKLLVQRPNAALWTSLGVSDVNGDGTVVWETDACSSSSGTWSFIARDESGWLKGDFNGDNIVNSIDFSLMNPVWFTSDARYDIDENGQVNSLDFSLLNRNWFRTKIVGRVTPLRQFTLARSASCS
jgi:pimeloyl-ACP methyl ester carboxylesterase